MQVPAFDLTRQNQHLQAELERVFQTTVARGHFILGEEVKRFETELADFLGVPFAIGVANGSDALALALLALGIKPGDEVIVPGFTFFATAGAVTRIGGTPVFVDVSAWDYNVIPKLVEAKITERTRAVIPVHLFGMPADLEPLLNLAQLHNLAIIEDVAQALGTTYAGKMAGTLGTIGCFSFFPTKNLGCFGDAGLVTTRDEELADRLRMLRVHGARRKYYHELPGFNSRLDTLQAAILRVKLPHLEEWLAVRRRIAGLYREELQGIAEISLPIDSPGHSYNQFTIAVINRDHFRAYLKEWGIDTTVYYPLGLHLQPVYAPLGYRGGNLPTTEILTEQVVSLPLFPEMTETEQSYVIEKIQEYYRRSRQ